MKTSTMAATSMMTMTSTRTDMKTFHLAAAILFAALFFASCDRNAFEPVEPENQVETVQPSYADSFNAFIESPDKTRTSLEENGDNYKVIWSNGDKVTLLTQNIQDGNAINGTYTYSTTGDGIFGLTEGQGPDRQTAAQWTAIYPADDNAVMENESISLSLPAMQTYASGTFGQGAYPMVASVTGPAAGANAEEWEPDFYFKGLCGVLRLNLTASEEEAVKSIVLDTPGSAISGKFIIGPECSIAYDGQDIAEKDTRVTLNCESGVKVGSSAQTFIMVLPAGEYKGFSITVYTDKHFRRFALKSTSSIKIERACISDINLNVSSWNYRYETVSTRQLTYSEAKSLSNSKADISELFNKNSTILSFLNFGATGYGSNDGSQYKAVVLNYPTTDPRGNVIWASGRIYYTCDSKGVAKAPDHIVLDSHYTIGASAEAPSEFWTFDVGIALQKGLVVAPDYVGYGSTRNMDHPYICYDECAKNELDMVRAAKSYMKDQGQAIADNINFYSIGYSQGGSTALGVQRYIENNDLTDEFNLKKAYCGGGVYKPELFLNETLDKGVATYPAGIPLIILGLKYTYPEIITDSVESYFSAAFNNAGIIDMVRSKEYDVDQLCSLINTAVKGKGDYNVNTNLILSSAALDHSSSQYINLQKAIKLQDLTDASGWKYGKPKANVYFFHYEDDEIVNISQFNAAKSAFNSQSNVKCEEANYRLAGFVNGNLAGHRGYAGVYYARMISGAYKK